MNAPLAGALVLFAGWIAAFVVMIRRAQRGRLPVDETPTDPAPDVDRRGMTDPT
jgi:hypothetical protein